MDIALKIRQLEFSVSEVRDAVDHAIRTETEQAKLRRDYYAEMCRTFEREYNMSSDEFLVRFEAGDLGDDVAYFDWYAAKRGFDLWEKHYRILSGVSL